MALDIQLILTDNISALRSAMAKGINLNQQDEEGNTLLMSAASLRRTKTVNALIEEGTNLRKERMRTSRT